MNQPRPTARSKPKACLALMMSLALIMMTYLPALSGTVALQTASAATKTCNVTVYQKTDKNGADIFESDSGARAYCYKYGLEGPGKEGRKYTHYKKGTHATDYLIAKGYPNTKTFDGKEYSATLAREITQIAAWLLEGSTDFEEANSDLGKPARWLVKKAKAYEGGDDEIDGASCIISVDGDDGIQPMLLANVLSGSATIRKHGAGLVTINGNESYSLEGARFGIYSDSECTKLIDTVTTNAKGRAESDTLEAGTYYLKELKAPAGYVLEQKARKFIVSPGKDTKVDVEEDEQYGSFNILLNKLDADTGKSSPEGNGSLAGAIFELSGNGKTTRFKTNSSGRISMRTSDNCYVSGDKPDIRDGVYVFPLGNYSIKEISAPTGYLPSNKTMSLKIESKGSSSSTDVDISWDQEAKGPFSIKENVIRGGLVIGKGDAGRYEHEQGTYYNYAQGDASFEGAEFTLFNKSENEVAVDINGDGNIDAAETFAPDAKIMTIATSFDEELQAYVAKTDARALPFGSYHIKETKSPEGYQNTGVIEKSFSIEADGRIVQLVREDGMLNNVIMGGVQITKQDAELGKPEAIGGQDHKSIGDERYRGSSLNGIEFELKNQSEHGVLVESTYYKKGDVITTLVVNWNEEAKSYTAKTSDRLLPYGTYSIQEVKSNESYLLSDGEPRQFQIREDGACVSIDTAGNDLIWSDYVVRSDLQLYKKAADTGKHLAGIPFLITNTTTGESHVAVTDSNGTLNTEAGAHAHTDDTNGNDSLIGKTNIKASDINTKAGIWFGLAENGSLAPARDDLGALPFGHYTIEELACEANEDWQLWSDSFDVIYDRSMTTRIIDLGTVDDLPKEKIGTTARDRNDGDKQVNADGIATIIDRVEYQNLVVGKEYTLSGTLMLKKEKKALVDADNNAITSQTTFTPTTTNGSIELEFSFDASKLAGNDIVVFEKLLQADAVVATHEDYDDGNQTIEVSPKISTTAKDKEDGDKYIYGSSAVIVDTVSYHGLEPNETYTMTATLMDQQTGKAIEQADGTIVSHAESFTPQNRNGKLDIELKLDATSVQNKNLVVFETCKDSSEKTVASHEDLDDEGQTVYVAKLKTSAVNKDTQDKLFDNEAKTVTITDTVSYWNLEIGEKYTVTGTLMDRKTGKPIKEDGRLVTGKTTFTADDTDGQTEVEFTFSPSKVKANTMVAFEKLKKKRKTIAVHEDIEDEAQTVSSNESEFAEAPSDSGTTDSSSSGSAVKTGDAALNALLVLLVLSVSFGGAVTVSFLRRRKEQ